MSTYVSVIATAETGEPSRFIEEFFYPLQASDSEFRNRKVWSIER